jgi:hypothetical protein
MGDIVLSTLSALARACRLSEPKRPFRIGKGSIPDCGRDLVKRFRRPGGHETICPLGEAIFPAREDGLKPTPDDNARQSNDGSKKAANLHTPELGRTAMKRPLLMVAFLTLACAVLLAPIRSMPPMLLSDAGAVGWKCSSSALILTTCAPNRDVRFNSIN